MSDREERDMNRVRHYFAEAVRASTEMENAKSVEDYRIALNNFLQIMEKMEEAGEKF